MTLRRIGHRCFGQRCIGHRCIGQRCVGQRRVGGDAKCLDQAKFGIFSKLSPPETVLSEKDRVEIYRPLIADPKEVRRQREAEGKRMKKGGGDL